MGELGSGESGRAPKLSAPVPLTADHDLSAFDCGLPELNDWLTRRALKNESRFSRTYVVCDGEAGKCADLQNDFNVMTAKMQVEADQRMAADKK